jgi:hypothetical protein
MLAGLAIAALLFALGALVWPRGNPSESDGNAAHARLPRQTPIASSPMALPRPRQRSGFRTGQHATAPPLQFRVAVRGDDDVPVADARVTLRTDEAELFEVTDADGQAVAELRAPGPVLVHAAAEGHDEVSLESQATERGGEVTLVLPRSGELGGRVTGYGGEPQDLIVLAALADDPGKLRSAPVFADGTFRFAALPAGTYVVGLQPAGFEARLVEAQVAPGRHAEVELALVEMGAVDLTAVLPAGSAASRDAVLRLVRADEGIELTRALAVTSGVTQRIEALPVGRYGVELTVSGLAQVPFQTVEIAPHQASPLDFRWPASRIAGRVSGPSRLAAAAIVSAFKVVPGVDDRTVRDNTSEVTTLAAADGSYLLAGLDAGHYVVVAQRDPLVIAADVTLGAEEDRTLDLRLDSGRTVIALVRRRGVPIEGARVFATSVPYAENSRSADTDARGLVRLRHLTGSTYHLRAVWMEGEDGPLRQARADVDLDANSGAVELELD